VLVCPFLPDTAQKIYSQLGLSDGADKFSSATWGGLAAGHAIGEPAALFPRKDKPAA
jgi:methionyl-tRNA synthetase